jgi:hypothetical protein
MGGEFTQQQQDLDTGEAKQLALAFRSQDSRVVHAAAVRLYNDIANDQIEADGYGRRVDPQPRAGDLPDPSTLPPNGLGVVGGDLFAALQETGVQQSGALSIVNDQQCNGSVKDIVVNRPDGGQDLVWRIATDGNAACQLQSNRTAGSIDLSLDGGPAVIVPYAGAPYADAGVQYPYGDPGFYSGDPNVYNTLLPGQYYGDGGVIIFSAGLADGYGRWRERHHDGRYRDFMVEQQQHVQTWNQQHNTTTITNNNVTNETITNIYGSARTGRSGPFISPTGTGNGLVQGSDHHGQFFTPGQTPKPLYKPNGAGVATDTQPWLHKQPGGPLPGALAPIAPGRRGGEITTGADPGAVLRAQQAHDAEVARANALRAQQAHDAEVARANALRAQQAHDAEVARANALRAQQAHDAEVARANALRAQQAHDAEAARAAAQHPAPAPVIIPQKRPGQH